MISLQVNGMSCAHCVKTITQAVIALDASASVAVSLEDKRVDVASTASESKIRLAIEAAGYELPA